MGIVKGKVITGAVGPVTFSSWRDKQVVKGRIYDVKQSIATRNVSTVFGLGSKFSAILRNWMYPIHFIHDGAMVNRMNKAMTAILLKHRDKATGNFDFPADSFKSMEGFELNESSPLKENIHVLPQVDLQDGKLSISIPEFDIKKAIKFPTEADSCTIIVSVYIASLKTKDECKMNGEMTKTFSLDWSDQNSTAMEWSYDVPEGCFCVTSMALHFHKQWSNLQVSLNSKSFSPAMICDFSINPGEFKDRPKNWKNADFAFVDGEYPPIKRKTSSKNKVASKKKNDSPVKAEKKKSTRKTSRKGKDDKTELDNTQLQQQENEALKSEVNELKARLAAIESLLSNSSLVNQQTEKPNIAVEAGIQSGLLGHSVSNGIYKFPVRDALVAPQITLKALSGQVSTKNRGKPAA